MDYISNEKFQTVLKRVIEILKASESKEEAIEKIEELLKE